VTQYLDGAEGETAAPFEGERARAGAASGAEPPRGRGGGGGRPERRGCRCLHLNWRESARVPVRARELGERAEMGICSVMTVGGDGRWVSGLNS
jgi:hypothetical protein